MKSKWKWKKKWRFMRKWNEMRREMIRVKCRNILNANLWVSDVWRKQNLRFFGKFQQNAKLLENDDDSRVIFTMMNFLVQSLCLEISLTLLAIIGRIQLIEILEWIRNFRVFSWNSWWWKIRTFYIWTFFKKVTCLENRKVFK